MARMSSRDLKKFMNENPDNPATKVIQEQLEDEESKNCRKTKSRLPDHDYEFHEIANIYPMGTENEIQEIAESIRERGQLHTIKIYEDKILDGRNREKACRIAGVTPRYEQWTGSYQEAIDFVIAENEHRRHLSSSQRAACIVERQGLLEKLEQESRDRQKASIPKKGEKGFRSNAAQKVDEHKDDSRNPNKPTTGKREKRPSEDKNERTTNAKLAKLARTNRQYVNDVKTIKEKHPDKFEEIRIGKKTIPEIKKILKVEEREKIRQERLKKAKKIAIPDKIEIHHGDCLELSQNIEPDSIDAIITDPPYPHEFIDCWSKLGQIGARVLRPGGFCIAYTGVMYLPEVIQRMGEHLEYFWTISLVLSGPGSKAHCRSVVNRYRPILVYVKPPVNENIIKKNRTHFLDIIQGSGRQKALHEWQQSQEELKCLFENFTELNNTVLDPFAGSGTVLAVAKEMSRHAIGYEIEQKHVDTIKVRLGEFEKAS